MKKQIDSSEQRQEHDLPKQRYEKPRIERVKLFADQVLTGECFQVSEGCGKVLSP